MLSTNQSSSHTSKSQDSIVLRSPRSPRSPARTPQRSPASSTGTGGHSFESVVSLGAADGAGGTSTTHYMRLIRARDEMLVAKSKEVGLVSEQNARLRSQLDGVEAEMTQLQNLVASRDEGLQTQRREIAKLTRANRRLQEEIDEKAGREKAVEVTAAQAARLLKLLEQEELKRDLMLREKDAAQDDLRDMRERYRTMDARNVEREAELQLRLGESLKDAASLRERYSGVEDTLQAQATEIVQLKTALMEAKQLATDEIARQKGELYAQSVRVQGLEDLCHQLRDAGEGKEESLGLLLRQNAAAEVKLKLVTAQAEEAAAVVKEVLRKREEDIALAAAHSQVEKAARDELIERARQAGRAAVIAEERCRDAENLAAARADEVILMETKLQELVQKIESLTKQNDQLSAKVATASIHLKLQKALDTFTQQAGGDLSVGGTTGSNNTVRGGDVAAQVGGVATTAWAALQHQTWSKSQVLARYLDTYTAFVPSTSTNANTSIPPVHTDTTSAIPPGETDTPAPLETVNSNNQSGIVQEKSTITFAEDSITTGIHTTSSTISTNYVHKHIASTMSLHDCGLSDADLERIIMSLLRKGGGGSCISILDLSSNLFTDASAYALGALLEHPACNLCRLDLRFNQMSMEGLRHLAIALEKAKHRNITHVYVHSEGRIDALGGGLPAPVEVEKSVNSIDTNVSKSTPLVSICVVDARDNTGSGGGSSQNSITSSLVQKVRASALASMSHNGMHTNSVSMSGAGSVNRRHNKANNSASLNSNSFTSSSTSSLARLREKSSSRDVETAVAYGGKSSAAAVLKKKKGATTTRVGSR